VPDEPATNEREKAKGRCRPKRDVEVGGLSEDTAKECGVEAVRPADHHEVRPLGRAAWGVGLSN